MDINSFEGTFLHVGCGNSTKERTPFANFNWKEIRFDINPNANPDIIGTITDMKGVNDHSVDAIFSSHNIEHVFCHEVPQVLSEFKRVLKADGFALITCPDLTNVCELISQDKLLEPAYESPSGPISPIDIVYGHRASIAAGNHYMAHKCGFTPKVLNSSLIGAGFKQVATLARKSAYDIWALATNQEWEKAILEKNAKLLFP